MPGINSCWPFGNMSSPAVHWTSFRWDNPTWLRALAEISARGRGTWLELGHGAGWIGLRNMLGKLDWCPWSSWHTLKADIFVSPQGQSLHQLLIFLNPELYVNVRKTKLLEHTYVWMSAAAWDGRAIFAMHITMLGYGPRALTYHDMRSTMYVCKVTAHFRYNNLGSYVRLCPHTM